MVTDSRISLSLTALASTALATVRAEVELLIEVCRGFDYDTHQCHRHRFERMAACAAQPTLIGNAALALAGVVQQRLDDEPLTWREDHHDHRQLLYLNAELEF